jgi:orotidine-5'-phosphate decarboxylase
MLNGGILATTSSQYAKAFFEVLNFDAITVAPYMGEDSVRPFLEYDNKWTIVLGLTSNKGADDFQKLLVSNKSGQALPLVPGIADPFRPGYLYEEVIEKIAGWGTTGNLMFVTGATKASDFEGIRNIIPEHFLLVPGVGFQGGSLKEVAKYGLNEDCGLLVNASRAIIYASENEDFATEARAIAKEYQQEMQDYLMIMDN